MSDTQVAGERHATGFADVEAEHALQYKLLNEAERLLQAGETAAARDVAQQLYDYSDAHFGSEQVLMRLHSYPGYQAHLREHGELLAALRNLMASIDRQSAAQAASALRRWLTAHIHHSDQVFLEFLQRVPVASAT
jgi:hemerythrin